jgi:hypothetical protein
MSELSHLHAMFTPIFVLTNTHDTRYWCSANNPRGHLGQHNIDPPGGFVYGDVLPQAANYTNPKGAIVHTRGGSMPYFSYQVSRNTLGGAPLKTLRFVLHTSFFAHRRGDCEISPFASRFLRSFTANGFTKT